MALTAKEEFAERLVQVMRDRGYLSQRGAQSGVDVGPLSKYAGVSREMARRYTEGSALPDPNRLQKIAQWLNVRPAWLRDGEGEMTTVHAVREGAAPSYNLTPEAEEVARVWMSLPPQLAEWMRALLNQQAVIAKRYPYLVFGRPSSESYDQFERRAEQSYHAAVVLAAQRLKQ
jgi:transcriptional regulator with XRE-family HTH domain